MMGIVSSFKEFFSFEDCPPGQQRCTFGRTPDSWRAVNRIRRGLVKRISDYALQ
jgi:hypothetical protein